MSFLKKWGKLLLDFFEIVVPSILFLIIFLVFLISIVSRYFFRHPVPWTYEISILAFMWCSYFACGWVMRKNEHVAFGLLYDNFSPRTQKICNLTSNALVALCLLISIYPCTNSLMQSVTFTGVLRIPFKYAYLPFIVMMADITIRSVYNLVLELQNKNVPETNPVPIQEEQGGKTV